MHLRGLLGTQEAIVARAITLLSWLAASLALASMTQWYTLSQLLSKYQDLNAK